MNEKNKKEWAEWDEGNTALSEEESRPQSARRRPERDENLSEKSSSELEDEIRMIREEMDVTLRRLEHTFSPGKLLDRALHQWSGEPKEFASNLGYAVRDNPVPATLAGVSIAWLMASSGSSTHETREHRSGQGKEKFREMSQKVGDKFHQMGERMHGGAASASESMHEAEASVREGAGKVRGRAREFREEARRQSRQMKEGASQMKNEHPAVLAGIGLAVGALLGAAIPPTRPEDRAMGEARDSAMEQVRAKGREQAQAAEDVLRAGAESAREEAERRLH